MKLKSKPVRIIMGSQSDEEQTNKLLAVLKEINVPYCVSIASCHRNQNELKDFILWLESNIIVFIGGMSLAAPGIIRAILVAAERFAKIVFAIPLDAAARSAIEDLPAGTPVITCGLNTVSVSHSITNSALAIGHICAVLGKKASATGLGRRYAKQKKNKPIITDVKLVDGLIPIPKEEEKKR